MSRRTCVGLALVCVLVVSGVPAAAASAYHLTSPSVVDTPDRTVTVVGESFSITEVARVSQGDELVIESTAPPNTPYQLFLYDADRQLVSKAGPESRLRGNRTVTFDTAALAPGSYVVVTYANSEFKTVLPVVVTGYAVRVDAPTVSHPDDAVPITATLTSESNASAPRRVDLVVTNVAGARVAETTMSKTDTGYEADIRLTEPGAYTVHVSVRGERTVQGQQVILGLSDPVSITVSESAERHTATQQGTTADEAPTDTATATADARPTGVITPNAESTRTTATDLPLGTPTILFAASLAILLAGLARRMWSR